MIMNRSLIAAAGFVLASIAVAFWAYSVLPAGAFIPYHQGYGLADTGRLTKGYALALFPVISVLVVAILALAPRISARAAGLERSILPYGVLIVSLAGVFFVTQVALAERMMNPDFDVIRTVFLSVAALLLVVGNYLGKVRHNGVFGLKTPWTLNDPRVWDKTHRVVARLMVVGGLGLIAACILIADVRLLIAVMILLTAGPPIYGIGYSRRVWRLEHQA
jgi:uncharacterized membrane protein